ncbi:MAG: hypothetical protein D3926_17245 [Desulfobacteraceae bacterium]|nr:MAG: hypothetical protein D3926_17245 [Desulfobacteraceae bacterium]
MKIDSSAIHLSSTRETSEKSEISIERRLTFASLFDQRMGASGSGEGRVLHASQWTTVRSFEELTTVEVSDRFLDQLTSLRQILDAILEQLNTMARRGYRLELIRFDRIHINVPNDPFGSLNGMPSGSGFGFTAMMAYHYEERVHMVHHEYEHTGFSANGRVNTQDGDTFDFTFHMDLEREFFKEGTYVHEESGFVLVDPLVISLDGSAPRFSEAAFSFDLDMDGAVEDLAKLEPGTGFLAFDKNGDGTINDGSELFGPSSGNGFEELSGYDTDSNFWIDENDEIFDELTIWENSTMGEMKLTRLKDAGIGAIYLASADTPHEFRDEENQSLARLKRSGIALGEDGSVLPVHEMDWYT